MACHSERLHTHPAKQAYQKQKETDTAVIGLFNDMKDLYTFVGDVESLPGKIRQLGDAVVVVLKQTTECGIFFREYTDRGFVGECKFGPCSRLFSSSSQ